jgi:regulator of replication initiation timing
MRQTDEQINRLSAATSATFIENERLRTENQHLRELLEVFVYAPFREEGGNIVRLWPAERIFEEAYELLEKEEG